MRLLVWQWGRRGAGPRYAVDMARALAGVPGLEVRLSLSAEAELMQDLPAPACDLPMATYRSLAGLLLRLPLLPLRVAALTRRLRALRVDAAICAMPAPLDVVMAAALRRCGIRFAVVVHDADLHPGDRYPLQMVLQRRLIGRADAVVALSRHVAERLRTKHRLDDRQLVMSAIPAMSYGPPSAPPGSHGGQLRLLCFGRLLPYKGLDLLADAMERIAAGGGVELRVVGSGPESDVLDRLRRLPGVTVENRWVPEAEVAGILGWADAVVLPYREASQSGVAVAALAAGRWVVATRVGGIAEQLASATAARLCDPEVDSLVAALRALPAGPPPATRADPGAAWRATAEDLAGKLRSVLVR